MHLEESSNPGSDAAPDESKDHELNNISEQREEKIQAESADLSGQSLPPVPGASPVIDLSKLPHAVEQGNWAIQRAVDRVEDLKIIIEEKAKERGLAYAEDIRVLLIGSMGTGHFTGPKPREHSLNPKCPFDAVVEGDLRIILPEYVDPHDPEAIDLVKDCLSEFGVLQKIETAQITRWDVEMHQTYFYQYDELSPDGSVGYEWEVCLNNEPYFEIADTWQDVFTPDEIEQQVVIRELLRHLEVPLSTEFNPTKKLHCSECRWRIVASYALDRLANEAGLVLPQDILDSLPYKGEAPRSVGWLVDMWLQGESGYSSVDRPTLTVVPACRNRIEEIADQSQAQDPELSEYLMTLVEPTQGPRWVRMANRIQKILKDKREQSLDRGDDDVSLREAQP